MRRFLLAIDRVLHHDFCPWTNRYVLWLKRPLGWLVVAAAASALVGAAVAPQGLIVCAAIVAVILLGLCWPWISLAGISASLRTDADRCHEDEPLGMTLEVRNRWPWPVWGLTVERDWLVPDRLAGDAQVGDRLNGDRLVGDGQEPRGPTARIAAGSGYGPLAQGHAGADQRLGNNRPAAPIVALDRVPGWSHCQFDFTLVPQFRGVYPRRPPTIRCGFPFGLAEPGRPLKAYPTVLVWPRLMKLTSVPLLGGAMSAVAASSVNQAGEDGDVMGVRQYRSGDSLRRIHWIQTARRDTLVARERESVARQPIHVMLDLEDGVDLKDGGREPISSDAREWTLRVGASICRQLQRHYGDIVCELGSRRIAVTAGRTAWRSLLDAFARWEPDTENGRMADRVRETGFISRAGPVFSILVTARRSGSERRDVTHVAWLHEGQGGAGEACLVPGEKRTRGDQGARGAGGDRWDEQLTWIQIALDGDVSQQMARQWERRCV